jgi:HAD superfamily hydrolase (TIGR01484 family)
MQPISAFPRDAARALLAVAFDIDDTVTCAGVLDSAAFAAMTRLHRAGLVLVAATGRPLGFAEVFARSWPVDCAVGENGAGLVRRGESGVVRLYWDAEDTRADQRRVLERIRARVATELPHIQLASDAWARRCDLAFDIGEEAHVARSEVDALCDLIRSEGAACSVSSIHAHAQLGRHDKATGIAWALAQCRDISASEAQSRCLFVGDSGNDAPAFAWFSQTAGVANVRHHLGRLPVPPRYVASATHGAGFAEIADHLLAMREVP